MEAFFLICFLILGGLWGILMWQTVRASRILNEEWAIRTSLPDTQLNEIITKAMKGLNPMADVHRPEPGVYAREVRAGMGDRSRNHSVFTTRVERASDGSGHFIVECGVDEWRGPGLLGTKSVSSVFKCRRRINAVMSAIQAADPSATILAHPSQPQLPATTGV